MAESLLLGAVVGDAVSKLSDSIIIVLTKTLYFKSKLIQMNQTLTNIQPVFRDIEKLNIELDRRRDETKMFINHLNEAHDLVRKCEFSRWNILKRYRYSSKLDDLNESLTRFVQIDVVLQLARDAKQVARDVEQVARDVKQVLKELPNGSGSGGGCLTGVPLVKEEVVGFGDKVRDLKERVVKDSGNGGCEVVVVSAAGGCGKTTLVTMVCYHPDVIAKFGEKNIYFVTISSTPNLKAVVKGLLKRNQLDFSEDEDAMRQWVNVLQKNKSPVLLVLDDVWSHSIVDGFVFQSPGYKILVTSRTAFTQFGNTYQLQPLHRKDATNLFHRSAFSEQRDDISDEIVDKLVSCCKDHPLALRVIGGMLNGEPVASWEILSSKLSEGVKSIWEENDFILLSLQKSLDLINEPEITKCFMDLGLFPEDQKISATAVMDIWTCLYNHDEDGRGTLAKIAILSRKNLATWLPIRKHIPAICNHCEDEFFKQHDMMRTLAIRMSIQDPTKDRLIINPKENDVLTSFNPKTINARLLSISTGEESSLNWDSVNFPNLEVFVLNFLSKVHPLPNMENMDKLKVLIVTNYGYNFSELQNFPSPKSLASLTTIRLDHISISSISSSILQLKNLKKLSLLMCKIGNSFNDSSLKTPNSLTSLLEIDIDSCDDLVTFPAIFCSLVTLKKLSITNCHEMTSLTEGFGNLTNLEVLRLAACLRLANLPQKMSHLKKLRIIDLSDCLSLSELPEHMGELQEILVTGCAGLQRLPESFRNLNSLKVYCDEEIVSLWTGFANVEVRVVKEDTLRTFNKIFS